MKKLIKILEKVNFIYKKVKSNHFVHNSLYILLRKLLQNVFNFLLLQFFNLLTKNEF